MASNAMRMRLHFLEIGSDWNSCKIDDCPHKWEKLSNNPKKSKKLKKNTKNIPSLKIEQGKLPDISDEDNAIANKLIDDIKNDMINELKITNAGYGFATL